MANDPAVDEILDETETEEPLTLSDDVPDEETAAEGEPSLDVETPEPEGGPAINPEDVGLEPDPEDATPEQDLMERRAEQDAAPLSRAPDGIDAGAKRAAAHQAKLETQAERDAELAAPEAFHAPSGDDIPTGVLAAGSARSFTRNDGTSGKVTVEITPKETGTQSALTISGVGIGGHLGYARIDPGDMHVPFEFDGDTHTLDLDLVADAAIVVIDGCPEIRVEPKEG